MATEFPMLDFKVGVEGNDKVEGLQVLRMTYQDFATALTDILHAVEIFWQADFFLLSSTLTLCCR